MLHIEYVELFVMDLQTRQIANRADRWNAFLKTIEGKKILECIRATNKTWKPNENIGARISHLFADDSDSHHSSPYTIDETKIFRLSSSKYPAQTLNMLRCICLNVGLGYELFDDNQD